MATNYRKRGSTEPEEVTLSATGLSDLDLLTAATWYQRDVDGVLKVDGGAMTVLDSATRKLTFDPVGKAVGGGDAFDAVGKYQIYVKAVWNDSDETRHPDKGYDLFDIQENFE